LFRSIEATDCLTRREKRVLAYLWSRCTTRIVTCRDYPGHDVVGSVLGVRPSSIESALRRLERKGFVRSTGGELAPNEYRLNALLLESAYDSVKSQQ
jgi:DNA-binding MarR family transcriptional regulator